MAITFPRAMPDALSVVGLSFTLASIEELSPLRSGRKISKDLGPALWKGRWSSARLLADKAGEARAWYQTLRSQEEFYGFDHARAYPLAYRRTQWAGLTVGGSPFDGTGSLVSVASGNVSMTVDELPVGFAVAPGDYLAFDYLDTRALHCVSAAAVANGSGALTVEVRPHIRPGWAADAVVQFYRSAARMVVLPGTYSEQNEMLRFTTISFEAIQTL